MLTEPGGKTVCVTERRKDVRFEVTLEMPLARQSPGDRIEGHVRNESSSGAGVIFPRESKITGDDRICVVVNRERKLARVAWVQSDAEGDLAGLEWL